MHFNKINESVDFFPFFCIINILIDNHFNDMEGSYDNLWQIKKNVAFT